jgi:hypothetical protein
VNSPSTLDESTFKAELGALETQASPTYVANLTTIRLDCYNWLARLPVTHEAAGSSPVAPAKINSSVQTCPFPIRESKSKCISERLPRVATGGSRIRLSTMTHFKRNQISTRAEGQRR